MYIDFQTIITAAAVLAAIFAIFGYIVKAEKWYLLHNRQNAEFAQL